MATIKQLLNTASLKLKSVTDTPRLDAELLMGLVSGLNRAGLISSSDENISAEKEARFERLLERRLNFESLALITGYKEFYGLEFHVSKDVLTPRPETELIVDLALKELKERKDPLRILDLGTGSACISVAIGHQLRKEQREFSIDALDVSSSALEIASMNIRAHSLENNIRLLLSDWFGVLEKSRDQYDLIVSNPPYIAEGDQRVSKETQYEPAGALYSGQNGLESAQFLITNVRSFLKSKSCFIFEIGDGQRDALEAFALGLYSSDEIIFSAYSDLSGKERAIKIQFVQ